MCHSDYSKFFSEGYCPSGQSLLLNGRLVKILTQARISRLDAIIRRFI